MAFTMHSHSGQFCPGHAADQLQDIIQRAIALGFNTIGLSEHMPRYEERDLYPEELPDAQASLQALPPRHEAYLAEAQRLQTEFRREISVLIGFEAEFIRPSYAPLVRNLALAPCIDYFIGSVHHVHSIPIDYDGPCFRAAVAAAGGTEERLYEDYYDLQHEMLLALRPRVVGHFDLVRLKSERPDRDVRGWSGVWARITRNLRLVREQGGWLECNTAALRKGLSEPYPCLTANKEWVKMNGAFTMSDDSHGVAQVGTHYMPALSYLESLGVENLWTLERQPHHGLQKPVLLDKAVSIDEFRRHLKIIDGDKNCARG
ncbi:hypothetical protein UVI_02056520 [Ustilaginoidea virens]|uniref:Histidinol-phosphatase n=1 Tax=Ustilaginoidea virens TaxID=1159556 RepID=A0A1B5L629_USTVR|nr:hypothetical protein UVI_02056520 [Ustilaginoidea virens]